MTPKTMNPYLPSRVVVLVCALFLVSPLIYAQDIPWPQFRGPDSNPVGAHARLAERWSKTENVEWSQEIPGTRVVFADRYRRQGVRHNRND